MADTMLDMEEINECMGQNFNVEYDENELLGELDELDEELAMEQLDAGLSAPSYVPNSQKTADAESAQGQAAQGKIMPFILHKLSEVKKSQKLRCFAQVRLEAERFITSQGEPGLPDDMLDPVNQ